MSSLSSEWAASCRAQLWKAWEGMQGRDGFSRCHRAGTAQPRGICDASPGSTGAATHPSQKEFLREKNGGAKPARLPRKSLPQAAMGNVSAVEQHSEGQNRTCPHRLGSGRKTSPAIWKAKSNLPTEVTKGGPITDKMLCKSKQIELAWVNVMGDWAATGELCFAIV